MYCRLNRSFWLLPVLLAASLASSASPIADRASLAIPGQTSLEGFLGCRYDLNWKNRLMAVSEDELLSGFRHRPGVQAWIGEHVGKWLDAASRVWLQTHDKELREKMDRVASGLMATQEPDGYLGTYAKGYRFGMAADNEWDVWNHKYDLIGLLAYSKATGSKPALASAVRIGDLMIKTFGPQAVGINKAGTHKGMAATSILEPMVYLYRATKQAKYLEFCKGLVEQFEAPDGSKLISTLMREKSVVKAPSAKAYEMLSNLVGLCELYRTTGEAKYIGPVVIAWSDIVANRLYITGTGASREFWTKDYNLPCDQSANVGETCVTVTWMQLNIELFRLFGEAKYMDQVEKTICNHLLAAQSPDGSSWCTYIALNGPRWYRTDTNCCLSSGPRGISMIPDLVFSKETNTIAVNLFETSSTRMNLGQGTVQIAQKCAYPFGRMVLIQIQKTPARSKWKLKLRIPTWMRNAAVSVNGGPQRSAISGTYLGLCRKWKQGDQIKVAWALKPVLTHGVGPDADKIAITLGPVVMSVDSALNPTIFPYRFIGLTDPDHWKLSQADQMKGRIELDVPGMWLNPRNQKESQQTLRMVPFYLAGQEISQSWVWLVMPGIHPHVPRNDSLFGYGLEWCSRIGNQTGSFADGSTLTRFVTYDGRKHDQDWFAVQIDRPLLINKVVFCHGCSYHDGGWFDTSGGKPRVQVQTEIDGEWKDVAVLESYPPTNSVQMPAISEGEAFEAVFQPVYAVGIRVIGKPSSGDAPSQTFVSCSELQAFGPDFDANPEKQKK